MVFSVMVSDSSSALSTEETLCSRDKSSRIIQLCLWSLVKHWTERWGVVCILGFLLIPSFEMEVLHETAIDDFLFCLCSRMALKLIKTGAEVLNFSILAVCDLLVRLRFFKNLLAQSALKTLSRGCTWVIY